MKRGDWQAIDHGVTEQSDTSWQVKNNNVRETESQASLASQ